MIKLNKISKETIEANKRKIYALDKIERNKRKIKEETRQKKHDQIASWKAYHEIYWKQASIKDYKLWLAGYFKNESNEFSHYYDYKFPNDFFILRKNIKLIPLYGSDSLNIIVPKNLNVEYDNLGHTNLYFMKDYSCKGHAWIPCYIDL
jgi:hypothetical protein